MEIKFGEKYNGADHAKLRRVKSDTLFIVESGAVYWLMVIVSGIFCKIMLPGMYDPIKTPSNNNAVLAYNKTPPKDFCLTFAYH